MLRQFFRILILVVFLCAGHSIQIQAAPENLDIPDGLVWMNSSRPLKIQNLKGKFVVVYFWNYSAKGVLSVVDQSRELQEKFPSQVVVIGVHTGKALNNNFLNDKVADALETFRINHPIAIDVQMKVLKNFRLDRLPAEVLLAPDGTVLFRKNGSENLFYLFSRLIEKNMPRFTKQMDLTIYDFQQTPEASLPAPEQIQVQEAQKDLSLKVMEPGLLGNTVLDQPSVVVSQESENKDDVAASIEDGVIESIDQSTESQHEVPEMLLDLDNYVGQKVKLDREYSRKIGQLKFRFSLGTNAKLLGEKKSFVRIYGDDRSVLTQKYLNELQLDVPVNHEFSSKQLYVEAVIYYCTHEEQSLCRIKNLLFVIPLSDYPNAEDVEISYNLPENER